MQNNSCEKPDLQDPDDKGIPHKKGCPVKHRPIVFRIEKAQVIENAGIKPYVNDQKGNQK
jgi:hypothetical protein